MGGSHEYLLLQAKVQLVCVLNSEKAGEEKKGRTFVPNKFTEYCAVQS